MYAWGADESKINSKYLLLSHFNPYSADCVYSQKSMVQKKLKIDWNPIKLVLIL